MGFRGTGSLRLELPAPLALPDDAEKCQDPGHQRRHGEEKGEEEPFQRRRRRRGRPKEGGERIDVLFLGHDR